MRPINMLFKNFIKKKIITKVSFTISCFIPSIIEFSSSSHVINDNRAYKGCVPFLSQAKSEIRFSS